MNLVEKCRAAVDKIYRQHDHFSFFAIFEREEMPGKWDILFAAPWLKPGRAAISLVVDALASELNSEDWQSIGSVIPLDVSSGYVQWIIQHYETVDGVQEIANALLDGVYVGHGYILVAHRSPILKPDYQPVLA